MYPNELVSHDDFYTLLEREFEALRTGLWFTDLSNFTALLFEKLPEVNWVGFYLLYDGKLRLGPFQGRVACTEIAIGRGVCGLAAEEQETLIVPDVHAFSDHIVCDSRSRSELVVPLILDGRLLGVLDVDSERLARFTETDARGLERLSQLILKTIKVI